MTSNFYSPRISNAVFDEEDGRREYMLILNQYRVHIVARPDFDLQIESNLSFSAVDAAGEWVNEVARDIAEFYGADYSVITDIINADI